MQTRANERILIPINLQIDSFAPLFSPNVAIPSFVSADIISSRMIANNSIAIHILITEQYWEFHRMCDCRLLSDPFSFVRIIRIIQ